MFDAYESLLVIDEPHDGVVQASVGFNKHLDGKLLLTLEYRIHDLDVGEKFQYSLTKEQMRDLAHFLLEEAE